MHKGPHDFWTDDRVATLKKHHAAGESYAEIAKAVGGGCTRGSALGKAYRIGLKRNPQAEQEARKQGHRNRLAKVSAWENNGLNLKSKPVYTLPPERYEPPGAATILTIGPCMCRWPIGDPNLPTFTLCGASTQRTYCEAHAKRAFVPEKPRAKQALTPTPRRFAA